MSRHIIIIGLFLSTISCLPKNKYIINKIYVCPQKTYHISNYYYCFYGNGDVRLHANINTYYGTYTIKDKTKIIISPYRYKIKRLFASKHLSDTLQIFYNKDNDFIRSKRLGLDFGADTFYDSLAVDARERRMLFENKD